MRSFVPTAAVAVLALLGQTVHDRPPYAGGHQGGGHGGHPNQGNQHDGGNTKPTQQQGQGDVSANSGNHHDAHPSTAVDETNVNWKNDLNMDKNHPACPEDFPELLFYDNFANYCPGTQPSEQKWTFDTGTMYPGGSPNWGTGEIEVYNTSTDNLVITNAGTLAIIPRNNTSENMY
ncbi:hypothetical protein B0H66DRAFT_538423 [Apodospora peruviana]|uniref:Uncharacterized protein n=1 Tax=Apodospora peruviana TaxID=516989 RepID=A0AAE0HSJ1_9PEZI|nr:hypothetical protein B0H66DRAFT_538423 [Apodospora peruviana]